ncbi:hypothetical protein B296_00010405 [Ensete ventricosum]|uniref:Uncharacterized protein n=1 Tax=Ensete ventricosum TaxID=4639 RepID=A0A427A9N3_ENSVE|nr:hypothetical protein B296_00010405 [Ensete ventricosum]
MLAELPRSTIILLTQAFAIHFEITKASSWSGYSSSPDLKVILGSRSRLGLFFTATQAHAFHAEELSPMEVGPPTITSIYFSIGLFGRGEESLA